jgi:hypothetical protein
MKGLVFDAGALIALERGDRRVIAYVQRAINANATIAVPAGVVAQVWRNGAKQVRLVRFLSLPSTDVVSLDDLTARAAGQLCGLRHTSDVIDASVVLCAIERDQAVVTSDPDDLHRLEPALNLIKV